MEPAGIITVKGIVQGVGFRPFVYARAVESRHQGIGKKSRQRSGNQGSRTTLFRNSYGRYPGGRQWPRIDSVDVRPLDMDLPEGFVIEKSGEGSLSGMIPPDIATCYECIGDINTPGNRYEGYWATSCVNCGPRYSIIKSLPYDRERTSMVLFPMCRACEKEYLDPGSRRHHAQTIASSECGPGLALLDSLGNKVETEDILRTAASASGSRSYPCDKGDRRISTLPVPSSHRQY